jgi:hypothetical protein
MVINHHFLLIFSLLSMPIHKFGNVFTAKPPRTQRVDVLFYPAVRGGRIKGSLSASGRDLHKAFSLEGWRLLLWRPLTARAKNHFLCDLCAFAVSK